MYSYRLQNLRQLDKSIHLRSNNTFCTRFRKDLYFDFAMLSQFLFSLYLIYAKPVAANSKAAAIITILTSHMSY